MTSYTVNSLVPDATYTFKIKARTLVGYSVDSSEISIRAATKPNTPASPVTTVISNVSVTITWNQPFNGGSAISSYLI